MFDDIFNFNLDTEKKGIRSDNLNKILFIFDNITWSNVILKLKLNNISVSGGSSPTRHILTTSDVWLNYHLNKLFDYDVKVISQIAFDSYKHLKKELSPRISKNLYIEKHEQLIKDTNIPIFHIDPTKIIEKLYSAHIEQNPVNDEEKIIIKKNIKTIVNNILISRNLIISNLILIQEQNLILKIQKKKDEKVNSYKELVSKYELPINSRKQRKIESKKLYKNIIEKKVNLEEHYSKIGKLEVEIAEIDKKLEENKIILKSYMKHINSLTLKDLFEEYENSNTYNTNFSNLPEIFGSISPKKTSSIRSKKKNNNIRSYSTTSNNINYNIIEELGNKNSLLSEKKRSEDIANDCLKNKNYPIELKNYDLKKNSFVIDFFEKIENPSYRIINYLIKENKDDLLKAQDKIEKELFYREKEFFFNLINNKNKNYINYSPVMLELVRQIKLLDRDLFDLKNSKELKNKKLNYKTIIKRTDNLTIITILFKFLIPNCIKYESIEQQNLTSIYENIGKEIVKYHLKDYAQSLYEKNSNSSNKKELVHDMLNKYDIKIENLNTDEYYKIGSFLVEFVGLKMNWIILKNQKIAENKTVRYMIPGGILNNNLLMNLRLMIEKFPMVCPPNDWEIEILKDSFDSHLKYNTKNYFIKSYGGYLTNIENKNNFINKNNKNVGNNNFINNDIIKAINTLSKMELSINIPVLKTIFKLLDAAHTENNLKNSKVDNILVIENEESINFISENYKNLIKSLIYTSLHPDTKDILSISLSKNKNKNIKSIYQYNSKYYIDSTILQLALAYTDLGNRDLSIYIPYFIDFRSRFYTDTGLFSYQASELAKSLLNFKNGEILTENGLKSLKIYTANCYGLDKKSIIDRLDWIDNNLQSILNCKFESDDDLKFIFSADEPLLFISCILELQAYNSDPENFKSRLICYVDATCNGLQHLANMIKDINLAKLVNINKSSDKETPNDVYAVMANKVNDEIKNLSIQEQEVYSGLNINRKFVKKGIMTIPYGATVRGICDHLKNEIFQKNWDNQLENIEQDENLNKYGKDTEDQEDVYYSEEKKINKFKLIKNYTVIDEKFLAKGYNINFSIVDINKLGKIIHSVLYKSFPRLEELGKYLKAMNNLLKKINVNTIWLSPTGIIVVQRYVKMKKNVLKTSVLGLRKSISIQTPMYDSLNISKQNLAIVPNIIHTIDASNVALVILDSMQLKKNFEMVTIHDCFGGNANNINFLTEQVKAAFIKLYGKKDFLKNYHNFILNYLQNSGFIVENNTIKNIEDLANNSYTIPTPPVFDNNKDFDFQFEDSVLLSKYFLN